MLQDQQQTILTGTVLERAVLYARVSGDDTKKDGRNLQGQIDDCRNYATQEGYNVVAEIKEDERGASGYAFDLPGLNKLLDMAQAGEFDVLVVREVDRLARNRTKKAVLKEELRRANIRVDYVLQNFEDDPYGRFSENVMDDIAELEREIITTRMIRGRRKKVKSGKVIVSGRPPYGYRLSEDKSALLIYEPESEIVKQIFEWYTASNDIATGQKTIADRLTRLGIATPNESKNRRAPNIKKRGKNEWSRGTVYAIIKNETYAGIWRYGKRKRVHGKIKVVKDVESLPSVKVPQIVSRETFDLAQKRLQENRKATKHVKYEYLLRRRVTCSCKHKMVCHTITAKTDTKTYKYPKYRCRCSIDNAVCNCNALSFDASQIDAIVWQWVRKLLCNKDAVTQALQEAKDRQDAVAAPHLRRLKTLDDLLARVRQKKDRLLDLYLDGNYSKEELNKRKKEIELDIADHESGRAKLMRKIASLQLLTDEAIQNIQSFVLEMGRGLEKADNDFSLRREGMEALNVQVILAIENGEKVVHASCFLVNKPEVLYLLHNETGCEYQAK